MIWIAAAGIALVCTLILLSLMPIHVHIQFSHQQRDTNGELHIRYLFGFVHVKRTLLGVHARMTDEGPAVQALHSTKSGAVVTGRNKGKSVWTFKQILRIVMNWQIWLGLIRDIWDPVRQMLHRVHVERCDVAATVGTGEVVTTGVAYGSLWALVSSLVGRMTYVCTCERPPSVSIEANFRGKSLDTKVDCILHVRAGYAMWAALRVVRVWRRRKTDGASHTRSDEDGHGEHP